MNLRILLPLLAYVLGSIPFSYIVARFLSGIDVRDEGSGNVGATNVFRSAGPRAGAIALLLDLLKGAAPVILGRVLGANPTVLAVTAIAVVAGHIYPIFLGFRGGKGVATATGVGFCLAPLPTGFALMVFVIVVAVTRFVSAGSISATLSLPVLAHFGDRFDSRAMVGFESQVAFAIIAALVVAKHGANMSRMLRGTESHLGKR